MSVDKSDLCSADIGDEYWRPCMCACGTLEGAEYYAWSHNRKKANNAPVLIQFEADLDQVRVDGRDLLITAFQKGSPEKTRDALERVYGSGVLKYADAAWATEDQEKRIALGFLATIDADVIAAHYASRTVVRGRCGTTYENAFTVAFPVQPEAIARVWSPAERGTEKTPSIKIKDIL